MSACPLRRNSPARFGVNRHTVRSAIAALEKEGIVRAEQGRGTFLNDRKRLKYPIGQRTRFSSGLQNQARTRSGKLISSQTCPAPLKVSEALALASGSQVVRLETVSSADGVPVSAATSWFEAARFAEIAEIYGQTGSVTASLALLGVSDYTRQIHWNTGAACQQRGSRSSRPFTRRDRAFDRGSRH
jgi:GntR family phosphonate transport system transcriptional regulator